ncbi:hypothetical protein RDI58_004778 [Solanum bulbocastanum]|uniref:Reverse transcriptase zinc-binding domain-containing protein n=1 Tax=Solanum bulbocastanum TaxID=147425 RepID=A0AAN8U757_SOLBU
MNKDQETSCLLCGNHEETTEHLFFEWTCSQKCMQEVQQWLGIHFKKYIDLQRIWGRLTRNAKGKITRALLWAVMAAVIWKARNEALWQERVPQPHMVRREVQEG